MMPEHQMMQLNLEVMLLLLLLEKMLIYLMVIIHTYDSIMMNKVIIELIMKHLIIVL